MADKDIIQFLSEFLPVLGELGARVDFLERRNALLEEAVFGRVGGGDDQAEGGGDDQAEDSGDGAESGELDFFGMKINLRDVLAKNGGDPESLKKRVAEWKAKNQPSTTPSTPSSTPSSTTPTNGTGGSS